MLEVSAALIEAGIYYAWPTYSMRRYFDFLFFLVGCSDLRLILALRG